MNTHRHSHIQLHMKFVVAACRWGEGVNRWGGVNNSSCTQVGGGVHNSSCMQVGGGVNRWGEGCRWGEG